MVTNGHGLLHNLKNTHEADTYDSDLNFFVVDKNTANNLTFMWSISILQLI